MTEEKFTRETRDGIEVLVYPDGSQKRADNGHFLIGPTAARITTSEQGRAMLERKRQKGIVSQLRGLANKNGVSLPPGATDEEILQGALDGVEALTAHMKQQFLKSTNIRGLAEAYVKLMAPLLGEQSEQPRTVVNFHELELGQTAGELLRHLREALPAAVEGKVIDADETR
jgi:hypothetical protein